MPPHSIERWRAVEITAPHYGSGYRIGCRLVLTAKHLVPDGPGSRCTVRARHTFGERNSEVVWSAPDADVALVALPEDVEGCTPIGFGRLPSEPSADIINFELYAWPKWAWTTRPDEVAKAGGRHIVGKIYLADTSPDGLLVVEPERVPETPNPDERGSAWTGISGAAVVCNGLVVAVQRHHQNPRRAASLEATPLSKVYDDPTWRHCMTEHGMRVEPTAVAPTAVAIALPAEAAHQPMLTSNLLEPNDANRLTYRARQIPFVGRQRERAVLERFLADAAEVSWLTVSGPGGSGKSRLVQEFVLTAGPEWRAGFLALKQDFDWTTWQPNIHTLIAVDYAAERVDEIRALLNGLQVRPDRGARVRVLLVEREANGAWMQELVGKRSDGYAIEQARFAESPLVLGPLSEQDLWETVLSVLRTGARVLPSRTDVLQRLREIDPDGRPLFAAFAADALLSGRDIREWDRDRLLRDVLERERQRWANNGVLESYENLLALVTAVGGETEQILEAPVDGLKLPNLIEFDRALYSVMTGCELEGDSVPALKPDLLGEFFVLEHVRGRNDRITAMQVAEFAAAAWRIRGGRKESSVFDIPGIKYISPSSLILFLTQLIQDFPDHPSTRCLLRKPQAAGMALDYWATLVALGIRQYAILGNVDGARALFDELSPMSTEELRQMGGSDGFIRAGLYLLPVLTKERRHTEALEVLDRVRDVVAQRGVTGREHVVFCEAGAEAVMLLLALGERGLVEELMEQEAASVRADPEEQGLWLPYARTLSAGVRSKEDLVWREQIFKRLWEYCYGLRDHVTLYAPLAAAALALCSEYAKSSERLADAEAKNQVIRDLEHLRSHRVVYRFKQQFSLEYEWFEDDLREIRLHLADSDTELIGPWTRAERFEEASQLLDEVERLLRLYKRDVEFARRWALAVIVHADARASQGATVQVTKAFDALQDVAVGFDGNPVFIIMGSELARVSARRAAQKKDMATASEMLGLLKQAAGRDGAPPRTIADYAEAAFAICLAYQEEQRWEEFTSTARLAAWAIRSEEYQERVRESGMDQAGIDKLLRWAEEVESIGEQGGTPE